MPRRVAAGSARVIAGFVLLLGFALPPLIGLKRVPTLRVLRRDLGAPDSFGLSAYLLGGAAMSGLIVWQAQDPELGMYVLGGVLGTMIASAFLTLLVLRLLSSFSRGAGLNWRFGLANLRRRTMGTVIQVVALGLGMMALILLTLVRSDLLESWQKSLPPEAPNRFLVNIQPTGRSRTFLPSGNCSRQRCSDDRGAWWKGTQGGSSRNTSRPARVSSTAVNLRGGEDAADKRDRGSRGCRSVRKALLSVKKASPKRWD